MTDETRTLLMTFAHEAELRIDRECVSGFDAEIDHDDARAIIFAALERVLATPFFTCDACDRTFPKSRPDSVALAEAEARGETMDDLAIVCDDCFKAMTAAGTFSASRP